MKDDDSPEKIRRFLKANGYVVSERDITQILNQMAQAVDRQIEQSSGCRKTTFVRSNKIP